MGTPGHGLLGTLMRFDMTFDDMLRDGSSDKHCIQTHFYENLTIRMLVNIHFQK